MSRSDAKPAVTPTTQGQAPTQARILLVDDQPTNMQIVGSVLGNLGYEIVPAMDGPTALKRLAVRIPDLILLDVLMPGMDGYEVCRQIRQHTEWDDVPIIFLSAADDKDFVVRALEAGGVDYITKPFNHAELVSRVRTHLALKWARDRLKNLAEDKDELLGIMAHDCKNHLGGMHMTAQLLANRARTLGDARLRQMAENIEHSSGQLLAFVKEFLANTSAEHSLNLEQRELCLSEVVTRVARHYQTQVTRKGLELHLTTPPERTTVHADLNALEQVLENLLSNAIKFSPPGKTISVTVTRTAATTECAVQDQGPGFTEADRARMFRRYTRLSARPTGGEPSTGLGLSIVKKLVEAMGGEILCETAPGGGAKFIVRFAAERPLP